MHDRLPGTSPQQPETDGPRHSPEESPAPQRPERLAILGGVALPAPAGFVIVNAFTSFNLMIGVLALLVASAGQIALAAWGLLLCVLLDSCDGSLARRWNVATEFGAQLDSLADMTSFIIASVALTYAWARPAAPLWLVGLVCGVYALAGAFRLARFNTAPKTSGFFQGMPSTGGAAVIAALYLAAPPPNPSAALALVGLLAALMASRLPYPKLTTIFHAPRWFWLGAVLGACLSPRAAVWVLALCYVGLGPAAWALQRLRGRA
jgi:CDP-diacylglycerol--serine O-phosphatidyltransferase